MTPAMMMAVCGFIVVGAFSQDYARNGTDEHGQVHRRDAENAEKMNLRNLRNLWKKIRKSPQITQITQIKNRHCTEQQFRRR